MEALKNSFQNRIRRQISNLILFGSLISITASGLVLGMMAGVTLLSQPALHSLFPVLKLLTILLFTVGGFAGGVFMSLLLSPIILRYAFFAKKIGSWNQVDLYSAKDENLPGKVANVFISGFSFGKGPAKPVIFVAEGASRILSKNALEAVFAHELSHLECQHLLKRSLKGISSFIIASLLTSILLIGMQLSGYSQIGSFIALFAGLVPAFLSWMTVRKLIWSQELEADFHAVTHFNVRPESLMEALHCLQSSAEKSRVIELHPLVLERMNVLKMKCAA